MTIKVGDSMPDVKLNLVDADGVHEVSMAELCKGKKVVVFGLIGAFTATCDKQHLPGFMAKADALKASGADLIACLSVNDAAVMKAWAKRHEALGTIAMLADGGANLTRAIGLEVDLTEFHMGVRCQRFAAVIDDGKVSTLNVEKPMQFEVSSAEAMLQALAS